MSEQSRIIVGDCRESMKALDAASVDSLVSDPPYGLEFMGKGWDKGVPGKDFWTEALRVLKPGAYLLAFGGTRTYHRLTCAIEDAGFEIQDCLSWLYGSGFPKHKSKLKPAWEPIILARKPAKKATLLNIDECRIGTGLRPIMVRTSTVVAASSMSGVSTGATSSGEMTSLGRWPANVVLDEEAAAVLDEQTGDRPSGARARGEYVGMGFHGAGEWDMPAVTGSIGGASRFFYCAKASRSEREAGLDDTPTKLGGVRSETSGQHISRRDGGDPKQVHNHHPTVKPINLMRWLVKLVTPPDGIVLDPFVGSGTTGCAAVLEGRRFIGCELSEEYATIARARIAHWTPKEVYAPPAVTAALTIAEQMALIA